MVSPEAVARIIPRPIRNWIRSPSKSLQLVGEESLYALGFTRSLSLRPRFEIRCHPSAYRMALTHQLLDPEQAHEFDAFLRLCRPGMVFFDIGAHYGTFSLAAAHYGGEDAAVVSVEPSSSAARILRCQVRLNGVSGRVRVLEAAAGAQAGSVPMLSTGPSGESYFVSSCRRDLSRPAADFQDVPLVTLDGLARESGVQPTHVKIDVEGYESEVLQGGRLILSGGAVPWLFIELHNQIVAERGGDPRETLRILRDYGYRMASIEDFSPLEESRVLGPSVVRVIASRGEI